MMPNPNARQRIVSVVAAAVLCAVSACSGDAATPADESGDDAALRAEGDACRSDFDCAGGLACVAAVCTNPAAAAGDDDSTPADDGATAGNDDSAPADDDVTAGDDDTADDDDRSDDDAADDDATADDDLTGDDDTVPSRPPPASCFGRGCVGASDCDAGEFCNDQKLCQNDHCACLPCGTGNVCNMETGYCEVDPSRCKDDQQCRDRNGGGADWFCVVSECKQKTACAADSDCVFEPALRHCVAATGECVECNIDTDCNGTNERCSTAHLCVTTELCQTDAQCTRPERPVCGPRLGACGECRADTDCAGFVRKKICDDLYYTCEECRTDADCAGIGGGTCSSSGVCLQCNKDSAECTQPGYPFCIDHLDKCVECDGTNQDVCLRSPNGSSCLISLDLWACGCEDDFGCLFATGKKCNLRYHRCE